jgi:hypothetical protein
MSTSTERLGFRPRMTPGRIPSEVRVSVHTVATSDSSAAPAVFYEVAGSPTVVVLMHPRLDMARHYFVPILLAGGFSVWVQGARSVGNDMTLIHEEALLDAAAGLGRLRDLGYEHVVVLGTSGGAALFAFYLQQATRPPQSRLATTPGGRPLRLDAVDMSVADGCVFAAAHPGQGELLLHCIDGAVVDEADPLGTEPELDLFSARNGFLEPPTSSKYSEDFLSRYDSAQRDRVARIDERARQMIAARRDARARFDESGDVADRRASTFTPLITVYRTDADPRTVDLSLDPSDRPYGSIHGRRPDVINFGITGFGRVTTPEAWLSTWSGLSTNAGFVACAPEVRSPCLFIEYTADQATFPSVARSMFDSIGSADKAHEQIVGTHFGGSPTLEGPPGGQLAGELVIRWLRERYPHG